MRVAHVAFELGLGDERRDRVDDDDVDGVAAREHFGDLERLFAGVGLRDQQVVEIDTERRGVVRIERVFDVDEGRRSAGLLRFGDGMQRERRLTARFRTVDLDDAAARETADAEREIERDRAGRDDVERHALLEVAHLHDRAFTELPLDLRQRVGESELPFVFCCHWVSFRYVAYITLCGLSAKGLAFI